MYIKADESSVALCVDSWIGFAFILLDGCRVSSVIDLT